jgi:ribokinase
VTDSTVKRSSAPLDPSQRDTPRPRVIGTITRCMNQAVGMTQLGLDVSLIAAVGDDEAGSRLLEQAAADGIDTSGVTRRAGAPTALIVSLVEAGGWRYLSSTSRPLSSSPPGDIQRAAPAFGDAGTVVIQLQRPAQTALAAAALGRQRGCRVVRDGAPPQEYRERLLATSDVVRADAREARLLTGRPSRNGDEAIAAGREILRQAPTLAALAAGQDGNALVWPDGSLVIPLADGPVIDTTGAGDAFIAALVAGLAHGLGPAESGQKAAAAAARTVRHLGGRPRLRPYYAGATTRRPGGQGPE